ncbi:MAG: hypothetical protein KDE19_07220 [Caldilineaceae bacterium]|nr:hypothetical protein [Caldilineaceae bacterium]
MAQVTLATTYHDPQGSLLTQLRAQLPHLQTLFAAITVNASPELHPPTLELLRNAGVDVVQAPRTIPVDGVPQLGQVRREVVAQALQQNTPHIFYCDGDRVLHWVERYPAELAAILHKIAEQDFTILGRTPRAFASHPAVQRETERIINHVYAKLSGHAWDITAAARGFSRAAAQAIVDGCPDDSIGVDASWPLFLQQLDGYTLDAIETEGLEFETATQQPAAVAAAGSEDAWKATLDADPKRWAFRLNVARVEIEAMIPYGKLLK